MKKNLLLLLMLISFNHFTSFAEVLEKGLLWKISGNGLAKPSYLLGTHHFIPASFISKIPKFDDSFNAVERVVGEISMSDEEQMTAKMKQEMFSPRHFMPADTTYRDLFTKKELQLVDSVFMEFFQLGTDQLKFRPAFSSSLMNILSMAKLNKNASSDIYAYIDAFIQKRAKEKGVPIVALETVDDQINLLFGRKYPNLQAEAMQLLGFIELELPQLSVDNQQKMFNICLDQNLQLLEQIWNEQLKVFVNTPYYAEQQKSFDELLKNRNARWMQKLPDMIKDKPTMIVVGAGHLIFDYGLINEFRKLGYTVEVVK